MSPKEKLIRLATKQFGSLNEPETVFLRESRVTHNNLRPDSVMRAEIISWSLTDPKAVNLLIREGIRVTGYEINGNLNLDRCTVPIPLIFEECKFNESINLVQAKIRSLQLTGSSVKSINAKEVKVDYEVRLDREFTVEHGVDFSYAQIGSDFNCSGGRFINLKEESNSFAINATGIKVGGHVRLSSHEESNTGFKAEGEVRFIQADISHGFNCSGGYFENRTGNFALIAQDIKIKASLFLSKGFISKGNVELSGAFIGGSFVCNGGEFNGVPKKGFAITAERIQVSGHISMMSVEGKKLIVKGGVDFNYAKIGGLLQCIGEFYNYKFSDQQPLDERIDYALMAEYAEFKSSVYMREGFVARGCVRLFQANIGKYLDCSKGQFHNPEGAALGLNEIKIGGKVLMTGFEAEGEVNLIRATIGGDLNCDEGKFIHAVGTALHAECVAIEGTASLKKVKSKGVIHFLNAKIGGNFECDDGEFLCPNGRAINCEGVEVNASVLMHKTIARGEVRFLKAKIGGTLECDDGEFNNSECSSAKSANSENYSLMAEAADIKGAVLLRSGFKSKGRVRLFKAKIGGDLDCDGGRFLYFSGISLNVESARIDGRLLLNSSRVYGGVSLDDCVIGQYVIFNGSFWGERLSKNKYSVAIRANGLEVAKYIGLRNKFTSKGELNLSDANINGNFQCQGAQFRNSGGFAINAENIKVAGDVFIRKKSKVMGKVQLSWAGIGGEIDCSEAKFIYQSENLNGSAFSACYAIVKGDIKFRNLYVEGGIDLSNASIGRTVSCLNAKVEGGVILKSVTIDGDLNCIKGEFFNTDGPALYAERAKIKGGVLLKDEFTAKGQVIFQDARVDGNFECDNGQFHGSADHSGRPLNLDSYALMAQGIEVNGSVLLRNGFTAKDEVRFLNAKIGGNLECDGGEFLNYRYGLELIHSKSLFLLMAEGIVVKGSVSLRSGFLSKGEVSLFKAKIDGDLNCRGGYFFRNINNECSLDACSAIIGENTFIDEKFKFEGIANFTDTIIGGMLCYDTDNLSSENQLYLERLSYSKIQPKDIESLDKLLNKSYVQVSNSIQPYEHLSKVLRDMGDEQLSKKIFVKSRHRDYFNKLDQYNLFELYFYRFYRIIDFGYNPLKSSVVAFLIIIFGSFIFNFQNINSVILPTKLKDISNVSSLIFIHESEYPKFDPLIYSIDSFLPVINLHQVEYWLPSSNKQRKLFPESKVEKILSEYPFFDGYITLLSFAQNNFLIFAKFIFLNYYFSLHSLLGWLFTLVWIAGFSGLVRRLS
jgi:hypothetical protein